jgi:hypothetical protein
LRQGLVRVGAAANCRSPCRVPSENKKYCVWIIDRRWRSIQTGGATGTARKKGHAVQKLSEYKAQADECRRMAAQVSNPDHKRSLIEMADTWDTLAETRSRHLQQQHLDKLPE